MIKLTDATLLAFTKLRAHKIRTIITVLLASLLFGLLATASLVMTGAFRSVDAFREDGLTSRYIVSVYKSLNDPNTLSKLLRDPNLIAEAKKRYEALVKEKTAEAKRLNLSYTQASDQPPYMLGSDGTERLSVNDQNDIVRNLLKEKFSNELAFDDAQLEQMAKRYRATKVFTAENYMVARGASLEVLKDGKEAFYDQSDESEVNTHYERPVVDGGQTILTPSEITRPFMLPDDGGWRPDGSSLPIILPQNTIERLLGFKQLPDTASTDQKLERLESVRTQAAGLTFKACYRNNGSKALIQQTIQQQKEIKANESKKDYQKPSLVYDLPDPATCENPRVASDTRTVDQKKNDASQKLFDEKFGKNDEPKSYFVSFTIVGMSPAEATQNGPIAEQSGEQIRNVNDVINNLLKTNGIGQAVPQTLYDQLPDAAKHTELFNYEPTYFFGNEDNKQRYVEFTNARDAQKFIDEQSCTVQYDNTCKPTERPYQASLAFSNSAAIDDIRTKAAQWFWYAMLGVVILAALIMWITIGRTIADGRHETSVFRAIGFKRIDITGVYILYTVILSVLVAVCAGVIGVVGAYIVNERFASGLTAQAQYDFGGFDMTREVRLIGVDEQQLGVLLVACLATGLLSAIIPLLRNVRRSPIRDMREE